MGSINISDRGFLLGDGVFTTLKVASGKLIHFDEHINRLKSNAQLIKINIQLNGSEIEDICQRLIKYNDFTNQNAIIRITITRGISPRGINIPPQELQSPTILICAMPFYDNSNVFLKICSTSIIRNEKSILTRIKSLNYLEPILARDEAISKGYDDGLMFNTLGNITESSVSNIFFLTLNQEIITPPIRDGVLPGIVRQAVITICEKLNIKCLEKSVTLANMKTYRAGFLTNCLWGIKLISILDDIMLSQSEPIVQLIIDEYTHRL